MKKIVCFAVCISFLFGGLLGLHLAAQPGGAGSRTAENAPDFSLFDPNVAERSEKELLERKVVAHWNIVMQANAFAEVGDPRRGNAMALAEAHAGLAAAKIELYRYTGEQDKLLVALKTRVEHLTEKLRAAVAAYELATVPLEVILEVELQLLDALLEQKRVHASLNLP